MCVKEIVYPGSVPLCESFLDFYNPHNQDLESSFSSKQKSSSAVGKSLISRTSLKEKGSKKVDEPHQTLLKLSSTIQAENMPQVNYFFFLLFLTYLAVLIVFI